MAYLDGSSRYDLMETGTRYLHYTELLDLWSDGIEILKNAIKKFDSTADKENLVKLTNARDMIQRRIDVLSDTDAGTRLYGSLAKEIDAIPPHVTPQLTEGNSAQESDNPPKQTYLSGESPSDYTTK
jgi:hypothetical protein